MANLRKVRSKGFCVVSFSHKGFLKSFYMYTPIRVYKVVEHFIIFSSACKPVPETFYVKYIKESSITCKNNKRNVNI